MDMHNGSESMDQRGPKINSRRMTNVALMILALILVSAQSARAESLLFFAAASTGRAIERIVELYHGQSSDTVRVSLAASSTLAVQITNGAPADLFLSANARWMDYLAEKNAIVLETRVDLLANWLALITAVDNPLILKIAPGFPIARVLGDGRLALADPDHVPAGIYAKAAIEKLGVWESVAQRLTRSANVRAAVFLVGRRETPLGVAYTTDVATDGNLRIVDVFPADTHPPIVYPLALVAQNKASSAQKFANFLASPTARRVFQRYGFQFPADR